MIEIGTIYQHRKQDKLKVRVEGIKDGVVHYISMKRHKKGARSIKSFMNLYNVKLKPDPLVPQHKCNHEWKELQLFTSIIVFCPKCNKEGSKDDLLAQCS